MDLHQIIRELLEERKRLTQIVESLEQLTLAGGPAVQPPAGPRRGRKSMDATARSEVSQRMKKYWDNRRNSAD